MPTATTWYEIVGRYNPKIVKRLVSTETAAYVFHPNGRKSLKGKDWHKTFEAARVELVRRASDEINDCETRLRDAQQMLLRVQNMTEETCQATG
jgi:hypothetical protein